MKTLYNKNSVFGRVKLFFSSYFLEMTKPTANNMLVLLISIIVLESATSINFLYNHFISKISDKSRNVFYNLLSSARIDINNFTKVTVFNALKIIPDTLKNYPVFLCVDDTIVTKFGKKFDDVSTIFDHAAHGGSRYLNGHCFVSVSLCFPIFENRSIRYISVPIQYRLWNKEVSKMELASDIIRQIMPYLHSKQVIALCDSWYAKKPFLQIINEFDNLEIICNARSDSAMYNLPQPKTGRGRKPKKGERIKIENFTDFSNEKIGGYYVSVKKVLTNIFGDRLVNAYVTASEESSSSKRLFFSTVNPEEIHMAFAWHTEKDAPLNTVNHETMKYVPLMCYQFRWNIEVNYYESKTFWSFSNYKVRSRKSIENFVNIVNIAYVAMKMLPYMDSFFEEHKTSSSQEFRYALSEKLREELILYTLVKNIENALISNSFIVALKKHISKLYGYTQKL